MNVLEIKDGIARDPALRLGMPVNFAIAKGEQIAIVGRNGSGKSLLTKMIMGGALASGELRHSFGEKALISDNIKQLEFKDVYGAASGSYYHQQRWNSTDQDDVPSVRQLLAGKIDDNLELLKKFGLENALDKKTVHLSSGELRKLQLVRALFQKPKILILDNPLIGLDKEAGKVVLNVLADLSHSLQLILVQSELQEIPEFITHVYEVKDDLKKFSRNEYLNNYQKEEMELRDEDLSSLDLIYQPKDVKIGEVVRLNNVSIRYGTHTLLKNLSFSVNQGERWALQGRNGAGKSTLLSILCADNPQSYACDVTLFGMKRGSGESIWDIKKRIGYVAPELHRGFIDSRSAKEVLAAGLQDGLVRTPSNEELNLADQWLKILRFEKGNLSFQKLSFGEQRLILLGRALIRSPELLILDEPFQGLDNVYVNYLKEIINFVAAHKPLTLIMVSHNEAEFPSCINHYLKL